MSGGTIALLIIIAMVVVSVLWERSKIVPVRHRKVEAAKLARLQPPPELIEKASTRAVLDVVPELRTLPGPAGGAFTAGAEFLLGDLIGGPIGSLVQRDAEQRLKRARESEQLHELQTEIVLKRALRAHGSMDRLSDVVARRIWELIDACLDEELECRRKIMLTQGERVGRDGDSFAGPNNYTSEATLRDIMKRRLPL